MAKTIGQVMLADILPPDVYTPGQVIDKTAAKELYTRLAERHPDKYKELLHKSMLLGRDVAVTTGGASFSLDHLRTPPRAAARRMEASRRISEILDTIPEKEQSAAIVDYLAKLGETDKDETLQEAEESDNPLARMLKGAGRGNTSSLSRLIGSDLMYQDSDRRPIPVPILRSYSQGLTPAEYIASSFGARQGTVEAKMSVSSGGYLSKLLSGAAHRAVVTDVDAPEGSSENNIYRGLPVDTLDEDNLGSLLAKDVGPYKRNTVITPKIMAHLDKMGHDEILVRSPITTSDPSGGVYARDVGYREGQKLPGVGESVGVTAAAAVSEPIIQMTLSSKHKGGLATSGKQEAATFDIIDKLFNTPKDFREAATHADVDGVVSGIVDAPQGGQYVMVGDKKHYVPPNSELRVKKGDTVEAGDQINEGIPNPRQVIKHKGLGEGARQLTDTLRKSIASSGSWAHRRNIELVVNGLVNRVRIKNEFDDYAPDDIVPYNQVAAAWKPREGHKISDLAAVRGRFLEEPIMHYTIGTRMTPSVIDRLKKHGIKKVVTHADPPPFEAEAVRAVDLLRTDPDWQTRQVGTGLQKGLLQATHRSGVSDTQGSSFVPGRAQAVNFNREGLVKIKPTPIQLRPLHQQPTVPR